jgi:2-phosphoglycerate kinase
MWDWIRAYGTPLYETFWRIRGMQEYKFIYKKSLTQELLDFGLAVEEVNKIAQTIYEELQAEASIHFGQPYFNTATIAGLLRMMVKRLAERYNKPLKIEEKFPRTPWWVSEVQ